ncbi:MAG: carboxymuconolactone decarboxylase family protein [Ruminococcus flavefaciens]|nr:carboxymuconolactone decarboxylase family protein [Ruminococcus flavefaciens]
MNRRDFSANKIKEFFGDVIFKLHATDPEYSEIMHRFLYGDIYMHGNLSDKDRGLITLVVLTVNQTLDLLKDYTEVAVKSGATPVEIKEALYQCAPYVGMTRVVLALRKVNEVFVAMNVELPLDEQGTTDEQTRYGEGYKIREEIFGVEATKNGVENAPTEIRHIQDYLCSYCFGDFYTRNGLDLKTRELLTFCMLASLGGCEAQLKAHIAGNLNVGNTKEILLDAITQCLPHIGFPRTLNAISCVREICG